jgi:hypothetical protein
MRDEEMRRIAGGIHDNAKSGSAQKAGTHSAS